MTEDVHTAGVWGLRSGSSILFIISVTPPPLYKNCHRKQPVESHRSTNMVGESGRVVSRSVIAFHSLTQLCSDVMQLS